MKLTNKENVKQELNKAGIKISTTRTVGENSFSLVSESWGHFTVNAVSGTCYKAIRDFENKFENISIGSNN